MPGTGTVYVDADLSVIRERSVGDGFHEQLTILNHRGEPVDLDVRIDAATDFADLFEVKDALAKKGVCKSIVDDGHLVLRYERGPFVRETWISATTPAQIDENGLSFAVTIEPHGEWTTDLHVVAALAGTERHDRPKYGRREEAAAEHGAGPRRVARGGPHPELRLGAVDARLSTEPRRPRRAAVHGADDARPRRCPPPACRGS